MCEREIFFVLAFVAQFPHRFIAQLSLACFKPTRACMHSVSLTCRDRFQVARQNSREAFGPFLLFAFFVVARHVLPHQTYVQVSATVVL